MSTATPTFGTQLIGQTEKTLNAILDQLLAGTGMTEPQWVTLTLAVMSGGSIDRDQFATRVAGALKVSDDAARTLISELAAARLLEPTEAAPELVVSDAGRRRHSEVRSTVAEITGRLWGDLPAADLEVAGRVLATVLERANAELAHGDADSSAHHPPA